MGVLYIEKYTSSIVKIHNYTFKIRFLRIIMHNILYICIMPAVILDKVRHLWYKDRERGVERGTCVVDDYISCVY